MLDKSTTGLNANNPQENAELYQWMEYCMVYVAYVDSLDNVPTILTDLNDLLALKTYLVNHRMTIADVLLYQMLIPIMVRNSSVIKYSPFFFLADVSYVAVVQSLDKERQYIYLKPTGAKQQK